MLGHNNAWKLEHFCDGGLWVEGVKGLYSFEKELINIKYKSQDRAVIGENFLNFPVALLTNSNVLHEAELNTYL